MASRTLAGGLGLAGDWDLGELGWKAGMDDNLLWLSVLVQGRFIDQVADVPGSPAQGDVYLLAADHATHPNGLAVYDEAAWHYRAPLAGWGLYNTTDGIFTQFDGAAWVPDFTLDTDSLLAADADDKVPSQKAAKAYVDNAIAAVAGGGSGGTLNGIVAGLGVVYSGTGLDFDMSAGSFYLAGDYHEAVAQTLTLDAADPTNPRIDVLYVDDAGVFGKISGTAAASPVQPAVDPTTQLYLTFVTIPAAASSLGGDIVNEDIYLEGAEWTATETGTTFTIDSTNNPYLGTKCIEATAAVSANFLDLTAPAPFSFDGDGNLLLRIRSKSSWGRRRWLQLQWFNGSSQVGGAVALRSGGYGFDGAFLAAYQLVVIPKWHFSVPAGAEVDGLRITIAGDSFGFYLDNVVLQTGESGSSTPTSAALTQDVADARYLKQASNLSDVPSPATARDNLGAAPARLTVEAVAGAYAFVAADAGKHKRFTNAADVNATVPPATLSVGDRIRITAAGAGHVTLVAGAGVTLNSRDGALKSAGQFAVFEIECVAANVFDVLGDVTT